MNTEIRCGACGEPIYIFDPHEVHVCKKPDIKPKETCSSDEKDQIMNIDNSVKDRDGKIMGYRCSECGSIKTQMWGTICNSCSPKTVVKRAKKAMVEDLIGENAKGELRPIIFQELLAYASDLERAFSDLQYRYDTAIRTFGSSEWQEDKKTIACLGARIEQLESEKSNEN